MRTSQGAGRAPGWAAGSVAEPRLSGVRRRRRVPYFLLGLLLVVVCGTGAAVLVLSTGSRVPVLAAAREIQIGQVIAAEDLKVVAVAVDGDVAVVRADRSREIVGRPAATHLVAGALLASDVAGQGPPLSSGESIAALALRPGQFPPEVTPGAHVIVVVGNSTVGPGTGGAPLAVATPSWPAVVVSVRPGESGQQQTVVSVRLGVDAAARVAAVAAGQLALVVVEPR